MTGLPLRASALVVIGAGSVENTLLASTAPYRPHLGASLCQGSVLDIATSWREACYFGRLRDRRISPSAASDAEGQCKC
jgi:hypothetical protein